ncbi:MAG: phosphatase, partial [Bacteroidetes bacterium]|nr:phosphatase [Bacteroidota bacterium]
ILNYDKYPEVEAFVKDCLSESQKKRLENVLGLLRGFASTYAVELLASVDYLMTVKGHESLSEVKQGLIDWSTRKTNLFEDRDVQIAYQHLKAQPLAVGF